MWRFWTVPKPGEPGSETWQGKDIEHGGAPTWFTGSYDPELDIVYWPTGNPSQEYNGDDRKGDNLYANSHPGARSQDRHAQVALPVHAARSLGLGRDADVGADRRRLAGAAAQAAAAREPQRLLLRVRSRATASCCWRSRSCSNLTWASGIGADGRPIKLPEPGAERRPAPRSVRRRTARRTGSRRRSIPATGLYYIQTFEKCSIYTKTRRRRRGRAARPISAARSAPRPTRSRSAMLKAIDIRTGAIKWELPQPGPAQLVGRHAVHGHRPGDFRRRRRRADGRRRGHRQAAVELPDEPDLEGVADDLHVRRQAVHRGRGRTRTSSRSRSRTEISHGTGIWDRDYGTSAEDGSY